MVTYAQIAALAYFIAYIVVFIGSMLGIKRKGKDPKGTTYQFRTSLVKLLDLFSILWVVVLLLCAFYPAYTNFVFPITILASDYWIIAGIVVMGIGFVLEVVGMYALGENFRVALPKEETTLVTHGIYKSIRNPIALSSVFLFVVGTFLLSPNILTLINLVGNFVTSNAKVNGEEKFLAQKFGSSWESYKARTGKYFPKFWLLKNPPQENYANNSPNSKISQISVKF